VGTVAVQLARAAGAHVIATGRAWARDRVSELGADRFIDLDRERFEEVAEGLDLVVDLVGGEILQRSAVTLKDGGILVSVVEDPPARPDRVRRARSLYFVVEPARSELEELGRRADAGDLGPVVGKVFVLADVGKAFEAKAGGGVPGKVVLRISNH
jgi:NADPH:quinone reductase-like Zn-dependent oxidoreductase